MRRKFLILGGTTEARMIANELLQQGHDVTSSLAGVTSNPLLPEGDVRIGGFGGVEGLRVYLQQQQIDVLIDATHPYAAIISANAYEAARNCHVQLLRFERPAWQPIAVDRWIIVSSLAQAASVLPQNAKPFITTGRKDLGPFLVRQDLSGVIRTVEPPTETLPENWRVILDRPPHRFDTELALVTSEKFTHIISKNAGSDATFAKLEAARQLGIPVVMVERPNKPNCESFGDIEHLIKRLGT